MKILITGGTGFVGQRLIQKLVLQGHQIALLTRDPIKAKKLFTFPCNVYAWNPEKELPPLKAFEEVEAVVHLLGENIASKRWSLKQKAKIRNSRILSTQNLTKFLLTHDLPSLKTFISSSAIGIYPVNKDENMEETSPLGNTFLSQVCVDWEKASQELNLKYRRIILRTGVILGEEAGALSKLLPLFRMGLGGPVGNGKQWMSFIHVDDLVKIIIHSLQNQEIQGAINAVAPHPVTNQHFTKSLSSALKIPAFLPVPTFMLKLAMGEMSTIVVDSQKVIPRKLNDLNFTFDYPTIEEAFRNICPELPHPQTAKLLTCHRYFSLTWVPQNRAQAFAFFNNPRNLEKLTPPWLNFHIITPHHETSIKENREINYRLKIHGIPVKWKTLITKWEPTEAFQDIQLKGPYSIWRHTHSFTSYLNGTLIQDNIAYRIPMGVWGELLHPFIKNDINQIFNYRKKTIGKMLT